MAAISMAYNWGWSWRLTNWDDLQDRSRGVQGWLAFFMLNEPDGNQKSGINSPVDMENRLLFTGFLSHLSQVVQIFGGEFCLRSLGSYKMQGSLLIHDHFWVYVGVFFKGISSPRKLTWLAGKSPFLIEHTPSFMVDFPASHVSDFSGE